MVALVFVILFIVVPIAELWLILQVGSMIGAVPTIAILLIDSLLGAWLVRTQGGAAWARFRGAVNSGRVPANEAVDGFFVILGGTLLLVPGFLTDVVGLVFVVPPTRKLLRNRSIRFITRRTQATFMGGFVGDDTHMRDFAHSEQPRERNSSTMGDRTPDFDFDTHQLHE